MKKIFILIVVTIFLAGCNFATNNNEKFTINTSIFPIYDMVSNIVDDNVKVELLLDKDIDIHSYELTGQEINSITSSDMFFYVSDHNEEFVDGVKNTGNYDTKFIEITDNDLFKLDTTYEFKDGDIKDPHIWISPKHLLVMLNVVKEELSEIGYLNNDKYTNYFNELTAINETYQEFGSTNNKTLITLHDAYSYLEKDYGINSFPLFGVHHDDEPTTKELEEAVNIINKESINSIYTDNGDITNRYLAVIKDKTNVIIESLNTLINRNDKSLFELLIENIENMKRV